MKILHIAFIIMMMFILFLVHYEMVLAQQSNNIVPTKDLSISQLSNSNNNRAHGGTSLYYTVRKGGPVMIPILLCGVVALTIIIERIIFFTKNRLWNNKHI